MFNSLRTRLHAACREGKDILALMMSVSEHVRHDDFVEFCEFLGDLDYVPLRDEDNRDPDPPLWFCRLAMPFAAEMSPAARDHLQQHGVPELLRLCAKSSRRLDQSLTGLELLAGALMAYPSKGALAFLDGIVHRSLDDDRRDRAPGVMEYSAGLQIVAHSHAL